MPTSEAQLEKDLIERLTNLKYTYRGDIRDRKALEANFREKFEALNKVHLTDEEFIRLLEQIITPDVFGAAKILRERNSFEREDGTPLFFTLLNIKDWCKNDFEVINQLRINTENSHHRYDVLLLLNGVPVVQIELKAPPTSPRRAMQQIVNYKDDPGNGYTRTLLCFLQLFIVSNRNETWYFANNNAKHFTFDADQRFLPLYQFADRENKKIVHLNDFTDAFLSKCILGEMVSRYMVLVASEQKLLMMRPYQIYAVRAIVDCIEQNRGNGYIWHTTGSGKTLTSFKASTLLKDNPAVEKCLFVVDRKDLDRQTREEFNRFQEGCVEENTNTETLVRRLLSTDHANKVIVTTIQKLGLALDSNQKNNYKERLKSLRNKRIVFIFDECHRSQFGENHRSIKDFFPNAQFFGFTGTPIFPENANTQQIYGEEASVKTTKDIFQEELHTYTITHAIEDKNVLQFHIDYYGTRSKTTSKPRKPQSQEGIVKAILENHDITTNNRKFNALLATASINDAIAYYQLFKELQVKHQKKNPDFRLLNIACVFSPPAEGNKDVQQLQEDLLQERSDNEKNPEEKKAELKKIITDYNTRYKTNYNIGDFDNYYKDIQKRVKDQQYSNRDFSQSEKIDIVIVVDMLLTGFDSKYLNTLYVDKNLKYHGLIQAFSRTNRVLNDSKPYGNILVFRDQQDDVEEAIILFSGESPARAKEIWLVDPAPVTIKKLGAAVTQLSTFMESQGLACTPEQVTNLKGDTARGQFINCFKDVQRVKTQLDQYTKLSEKEKTQIENIIAPDTLQAFRSVYLEVSKELKAKQDGNKDDDNDEEVDDELQNLDFEYVLFASSLVDYDFIMHLISEYTHEKPEKQKMTRDALFKMIAADAKFINEGSDIAAYVDTLQKGKGLNEKEVWEGYEAFKKTRFTDDLNAMAEKHTLAAQSLQSFVNLTFQRMIFDGDQLSELFTSLDLDWKERGKREMSLMRDLAPFLRKHAQEREISGLSAYEQ